MSWRFNVEKFLNVFERNQEGSEARNGCFPAGFITCISIRIYHLGNENMCRPYTVNAYSNRHCNINVILFTWSSQDAVQLKLGLDTSWSHSGEKPCSQGWNIMKPKPLRPQKCHILSSKLLLLLIRWHECWYKSWIACSQIDIYWFDMQS